MANEQQLKTGFNQRPQHVHPFPSNDSSADPSRAPMGSAPKWPTVQVLHPSGQQFRCCTQVANSSGAAPKWPTVQLLHPSGQQFSCCTQVANSSGAAPKWPTVQVLHPSGQQFSCCTQVANSSGHSAAAGSTCACRLPQGLTSTQAGVLTSLVLILLCLPLVGASNALEHPPPSAWTC